MGGTTISILLVRIRRTGCEAFHFSNLMSKFDFGMTSCPLPRARRFFSTVLMETDAPIPRSFSGMVNFVTDELACRGTMSIEAKNFFD
jgi:hypothetical protein